jgi:hypothetical protein
VLSLQTLGGRRRVVGRGAGRLTLPKSRRRERDDGGTAPLLLGRGWPPPRAGVVVAQQQRRDYNTGDDVEAGHLRGAPLLESR